MSTDPLSRLLSTRDWLMADGATGTNLFNMGLSAGEPPEFWNVERPDDIRMLYRNAVAAGSDHVPDQHFRRQCGAAEAA
jgi:5-methyltetrahydrofolate--homocysteine methyltransferase